MRKSQHERGAAEVHWEEPPGPGIRAHLAVPAQFPPGQDAWTGQDDASEQDTWVVWVAEDDWPGLRDEWPQPPAHDALARKSPRHAIRRAGGQLEPQHAAPRAARPGPVSRGAVRVGVLAGVLALVGAVTLAVLAGHGPRLQRLREVGS